MSKMINQLRKITDTILSIKPDEESSEFGLDFNDFEKHIEQFASYKQVSENLTKELEKFSDEELLKVYAFYYFGRSFVDGSASSHYSYFDMLEDFKDTTRDEILNKFRGCQKASLKICFEKAYENFETHESKVASEKEKYEKRQKSFAKKEGYSFFEFGKRDGSKSKSENIKKIFDDLGISKTDDAKQALEILQETIKATDGLLIVDFLGGSSFDRLDFVEGDDEVLKLYWKYSQDNLSTHNVRVDIRFDMLEHIELNGLNFIALKGYFADKKWIKNYYCNKEKIKKLEYIYESKQSHFYYDISFDKVQRGGLENFYVNFLPWRYFNILILPMDNEFSSSNSTQLLIFKNIIDLENRCIKAINAFRSEDSLDEDTILMYGNRFRKILESLLKFVLLTSKTMYKESYEKDMLGSLLEQLKNRDEDEKRYSQYDEEKLDELVKFMEEDFIKDLNFCSHDNVSKKVNNEIVEGIYVNMVGVISMVKEYFRLENKK